MVICQCGCDQETKGGHFLPGHDTRLRTELERKVGGIFALQKLVYSTERYSSGEMTEDEFKKTIKNLFKK